MRRSYLAGTLLAICLATSISAPVAISAKKAPVATIMLGESVTIAMSKKGHSLTVESITPGEHPGADVLIVSLKEQGAERCFMVNNMSKYSLSIDWDFQYEKESPKSKSMPIFPGTNASACQDKLHPISISTSHLYLN